jgi:hypothetical protein
VYEWRALVNGVETRIGWAVQSDGTQVGIKTEGGETTPAPPPNLGDRSFMLYGAEYRAERRLDAAARPAEDDRVEHRDRRRPDGVWWLMSTAGQF